MTKLFMIRQHIFMYEIDFRIHRRKSNVDGLFIRHYDLPHHGYYILFQVYAN